MRKFDKSSHQNSGIYTPFSTIALLISCLTYALSFLSPPTFSSHRFTLVMLFFSNQSWSQAPDYSVWGFYSTSKKAPSISKRQTSLTTRIPLFGRAKPRSHDHIMDPYFPTVSVDDFDVSCAWQSNFYFWQSPTYLTPYILPFVVADGPQVHSSTSNPPPSKTQASAQKNVQWNPCENRIFITTREAFIVDGHCNEKCFTEQGWNTLLHFFNSNFDYDWSKQ